MMATDIASEVSVHLNLSAFHCASCYLSQIRERETVLRQVRNK